MFILPTTLAGGHRCSHFIHEKPKANLEGMWKAAPPLRGKKTESRENCRGMQGWRESKQEARVLLAGA